MGLAPFSSGVTDSSLLSFVFPKEEEGLDFSSSAFMAEKVGEE